MADEWAVKGVSRDDAAALPGETAPAAAPRKSREPRPRSKMPLASVLNLAVGIVGLAALGATAWVYAETQREIRRVSSDIAQIRVSLELYGRQQSSSGAIQGAATNDGRLLDLANRLALLEASQRAGSAAAGLAAVPAVPAGGVVATGGDCLPVGTRFMVAAGDSYGVCDTAGTVGIASVDDGYITLADGTIVAQGGTVGLPNTNCMLGVMPSEGDGLSGYAEIRVVC